MPKKPNKPPILTLSLTVKQFCQSVPMSLSTYMKLKAVGKGPKEMQVGRAVRISLESARAWTKERERERECDA